MIQYHKSIINHCLLPYDKPVPDVGSSKMHRVGEPVNARATLSLRFCPPDRFMDCVCSFSSSPTSRSFCVTSGLSRQCTEGGRGQRVAKKEGVTSSGRKKRGPQCVDKDRVFSKEAIVAPTRCASLKWLNACFVSSCLPPNVAGPHQSCF